MGALSSINIRFKVDLTEFSSQMQNVSREVKKSSESMKSIGGNLSTYVTLPVLAAGGAAVKFASDYEESLNKVNVAFGDSSSYVENWAKSSLDSFGIAEGSALDMASLFGDMATSMGLPQKEAAKMSTSLTGLAGDLASFKNIGISEATTALNGIFTGETESLKRLGVVMTEANLKTFAYSQGITKQVKDMTEAEKVNLRYAFVLSKTKNAQGDFERTGGGAANQMRVFTESLKQVGQQLGAVILPIFTKVISFVNEKIKAFSSLSDTSKVLIVSIAGVAAAIGPLLSGLGSVLGFLPNIISSVKNIGSAWSDLTKLLAANPYTALAAGIALVVAGLALWYNNQKQVVSGQESLNTAIKNGDKAAAGEIGALDKLYSATTNVKTSLKERREAYDKIQEVYPAYFKNIDFENVKNGASVGIYNELRDAIFNKSRAMAIDNELQSRANDRIGEEVRIREKIRATEVEIQRIRNGANEIVLQEANSIEKTRRVTISKNEAMRAQYQLLALQKAELDKFSKAALESDKVLLNSKQEYLAKTGKLGENEALILAKNAAGVNEVKKAIDAALPGTVEYFEKLKSKLEEQQKTIPTTNAAWLTYEDRIKSVQDKIDALTNTELKLPTPPEFKVTADSSFIPEVDEPKTLEALNIQKQYYEGLRSEFSETNEQYKAFTDTINGIQLKIQAIEGVEEIGVTLSELQEMEAEYNKNRLESMKANQEAYAMIGQSIIDVFGSYTQGFVNSLGIADEGMKGFVSSLVGTLTKLIGMALSASMANSIQGATQSGAATGPGAVVATPAFIATAIAGIIAAFASIPKFEFGGIVGGSSFYGDKILARINSGEMILNQKQQSGLFGMMSSTSSGLQPIVLNGGFKISGSDIELIVERAVKQNNRKR